MKTGFAAVVIVASLSVGFQTGGSDKREVEVTLTDGSKFSGEILSVRDSSIVVANEAGLTEGVLITQRHRIAVLPYSRVTKVETARTTHIGVGMLAGTAIGCLGGYLIGSGQPVGHHENDTFGCAEEEERSRNETNGAGIGAAAGCALGAIIGSAASDQGSVLISPGQRDFRLLKNFARYAVAEPVYLQKIAP